MQEGVCVEYSEGFSWTDPSEEIARVVTVIKSGSARVLVAFLAQSEMSVLMEEAVKQNLTGLQWVGSESWITAGHLAVKKYSSILTGSLGFTIRKTKITGLREFLLRVNPSQNPQNNLLKEFWETTFGCSFQSDGHGGTQCSGIEKLKDIQNPFTDVSELRISNNVYKAVYAVAHAMHSMLKCGQRGDAVNQSCTSKEDLELKQVRCFLENHVRPFFLMPLTDPFFLTGCRAPPKSEFHPSVRRKSVFWWLRRPGGYLRAGELADKPKRKSSVCGCRKLWRFTTRREAVYHEQHEYNMGCWTEQGTRHIEMQSFTGWCQSRFQLPVNHCVCALCDFDVLL